MFHPHLPSDHERKLPCFLDIIIVSHHFFKTNLFQVHCHLFEPNICASSTWFKHISRWLSFVMFWCYLIQENAAYTLLIYTFSSLMFFQWCVSWHVWCKSQQTKWTNFPSWYSVCNTVLCCMPIFSGSESMTSPTSMSLVSQAASSITTCLFTNHTSLQH